MVAVEAAEVDMVVEVVEGEAVVVEVEVVLPARTVLLWAALVVGRRVLFRPLDGFSLVVASVRHASRSLPPALPAFLT